MGKKCEVIGVPIDRLSLKDVTSYLKRVWEKCGCWECKLNLETEKDSE